MSHNTNKTTTCLSKIMHYGLSEQQAKDIADTAEKYDIRIFKPLKHVPKGYRIK